MFYRKAVLRLVMVILFGVMVFWVDERELASHFWKIFLLLILTLSKTFYFAWLNLYILREEEKHPFDFLKYLLFFGVSASLIVLSFAVDYFCLYRIEPLAFEGIPPEEDFLEHLIAFLYFSLVTFTTAGYGDIYPKIGAARLLVGLELVLFLLTMLFILSNIHPLRESLSKTSKKPDRK